MTHKHSIDEHPENDEWPTHDVAQEFNSQKTALTTGRVTKPLMIDDPLVITSAFVVAAGTIIAVPYASVGTGIIVLNS
ncbi:hypothetical protein ACNSO8_19145 [Yersinia sp. LJYL362]|uniref:hypothetical protein n=1 Tax=Yersinia sp. LJYL362 TaxID=3402108 RepID=UPI003AB8079C